MAATQKNESLEDVLRKGYSTWRNNLILGVPFLLSAIVGILVTLVFVFIAAVFLIFVVGGAFATLGSSLSSSFSDMSSLTEMLPALMSMMIPLMLVVIVMIILFLVITSLISAFFDAGAVGMAKEATLKGKTSLGTMMKYGFKKFISLFFANIFVGIIALVGSLFILLLFFIIPMFAVPQNFGILAVFLAGAALFVLYLLIIFLIFSPMKYAIVISDTGAIDGVKRAYRFFMDNKLHTFLLWLFVLVITVGFNLFSGLIRIPFNTDLFGILGPIMSIGITIITALMTLLIISPLEAVWWSRFYISRTAGPKNNK